MRQYRLLLIVAAAALFCSGLLIAQAFFRAPPPPPPPPPPVAVDVPTRSILVAKSDLSVGQFLQESDFGWHDRPANTLRPDLYMQGSDSTSALVGAVMVRPVHAGEAIQRGDVVSPRDHGFLAAVLPTDMRSISVAVDEVTGDAGLIFPGDHVDVILTHVSGQTDNPALQVLGETVLEDLRVLAVDQGMRGPTQEMQAEDSSKENKGPAVNGMGVGPSGAPPPKKTPARTVTLEVSPYDAEVVAVAANLGKLTLVLRSMTRMAGPPGGAPLAGPPRSVWAGDVLHPLAELSRAPAQKVAAAAPDTSLGVVLLRGSGGAK